MFDLGPDFNDNNSPMYTWLLVRVWIDSFRVKVERQFPHLNYGNVFGAESVKDNRDAMEANSLMVHCCIDIQLRLTRANCVDYNDVVKKLNDRTTTYSTAFKYFRDRIPNYNPHP